MNNVMLDLETLGTRPGCIVLSIGAVFFDQSSDVLGDEFHSIIGVIPSEDAGLTSSPDTLAWWQKQSDEAKKTLIEAGESDMTPKMVFEAFNGYLTSYGDPKKVLMWGNGADFDNVILAAAYEKVGVPLGWGQYNNRCYRTMKRLRENIRYERHGVHHNALDDAKTQALHLIQILRDINK